MGSLIDNWKKAERTRTQAEGWNDLPNGRRYQNDTFAISTAHCKTPEITRAGQQSSGGQNYWKTEEGFNNAILKHIVSDWENIYPKVLEILKKEENEALVACQSYVTDLQGLIDKVNS